MPGKILRKSYRNRYRAFTLAELLICLMIIAEIATFTIPKILQSQQNVAYKSGAKEAIAMVSAAYTNYSLKNTPSSSTGIQNLTPYMNYVRIDTNTSIDDVQGGVNYDCVSTDPCLVLHNGGYLHYDITPFSGTATTNAVYFHIDPDGKYSGTTNGSGKALPIFLYFNGRLTDEGNLLPGTRLGGSPIGSSPSNVPPWFSWN